MGGLRLHYWRTGGADRPVLLLAHGITDYGLNWTGLAERLQQDYDVVMYDARGHGYSDQPDGPYDLATHVADLLGLIRQLKLEQPILMGHSMGGSAVALAAATEPGVARAIILEDPADIQANIEPLLPEVIPDWKRQVRADKKATKEQLIEHARTVRHPGWRDVDYELWSRSTSRLRACCRRAGWCTSPALATSSATIGWTRRSARSGRSWRRLPRRLVAS